jgi:hypothetical protein
LGSTVPDKYDLKPAEGSALDAQAVERTAATARSLGLSQEQAVKLLEHDSAAATAYNEALMAQHHATVEAWKTESRADPKFGGASYDANDALAGQLIEKCGSAKFKEQLKATGFEHHPEFRRFVVTLAQQLRPSQTLATGNPPPPKEKSVAEKRYPAMIQNKGAATAVAA